MVERKNRSILNMVRSMLKTKKMPKEFWAEVINCVIYLLNRYSTKSLNDITPQEAWNRRKPSLSLERCSTKSLNDITPQEAWNRRKPSVSYLKVFGSIGYVHLDDQVRTKLDDKSKKMIK
jgi:hypothetical protein